MRATLLWVCFLLTLLTANACSTKRRLTSSGDKVQKWLNETLKGQERSYVPLRFGRQRFYLHMQEFSTSPVDSCTPEQSLDKLSVKYVCFFYLFEMKLNVLSQNNRSGHYDTLRMISLNNVSCQARVKSNEGTFEMEMVKIGSEGDQIKLGEFHTFLPDLLGKLLLREATFSVANRPLTPSDYEFQNWLKYTLKDHGRSYVPLRIGRHQFYLHLKKFSTDPVVACKPEQFTEGGAERSLKYICFFYLPEMQLNVHSQNKSSGHYDIVRTIFLESLISQAIVKSDERILEMEVVKIGAEDDQMWLGEFHNILPELLGKPLLREDDSEEYPNFAVEPVKHNTNRTTADLLIVKRSGIKASKTYTTGRRLKPSDHAFQKWFNDTLDDRKRSLVLLWLGRHKCYLQMNILNISDVTSCAAKQITYEDDQSAVEYNCTFFIYKMELDVIYQVYGSDRKYKLQTISMANVTAYALIKSTNDTLQMEVIKLENECNPMTHREFSDFLPGFLGQSTLKESEKGFIFHFTLNFIYDAFSVYCCDANGFIYFKIQAIM